MRRPLIICLLCATAALSFGATCRKGTGALRGDEAEKPEDPFALIQRVSVSELAEALREGRAVAADVRPAEAFEEEHIEGAISIPEEEFAEHVGKLPKDKLVVTYCA